MSEQSLQEPTQNNWKIDPSVNDGFPFACDSVPDAFDSQNVKSIWDFSADGFPASTVILEDFNYLKSKSVWKIHASVNDGFPHIQGVFEIPPVPSSFPRFTGFSLSGIGADFKSISEIEAVSLPKTVQFQFQMPNVISFQFQKNQVMQL